MEFKLNEDQQMIHDLAKDFAESVLQPRIDEIEAGEMTEVSNGQKHPQLPHDIHQQLAECGFIGISFPEEYNGMGMGHVEQAIVIKELSRVSSVGKCLDVYILGLEALDLYANHEQKMKYLAPCCSGEQTVSFAFTEPETGSDPKMLKTRLEKQADGTYKLNGVKRFISNAGYDGLRAVRPAEGRRVRQGPGHRPGDRQVLRGLLHLLPLGEDRLSRLRGL